MKKRNSTPLFLGMLFFVSLVEISLSESNDIIKKNNLKMLLIDRPAHTMSPSTPLPTNNPSEIPSNKPSQSKQPYLGPSSIPSISQTPTVTAKPSLTPTALPSIRPSNLPSGLPSFIPTNLPTSTPSDHPTQNPTTSHSPTISLNPSYSPSLYPSSKPSPSPSISPVPSTSPSITPSGLPSESPTTGMPSSQPSSIPTTSPSKAPSKMPSPSPSTIPSSSPTLTCHDKRDYRSPINGFQCEHHSGTDCYQWRNLGLNTTELGKLINNCPETCKIPCGSFVEFSIPVSYRLAKIPGLLDDSAKKSVEKASFNYITNWMDMEAPRDTFELDEVELSSQSLVTINPRRNLRFLQAQEQDEVVLVTVVFDGFSIGLVFSEVEDLLVLGMNSTGFATALQQSDLFFETAVITSAASQDPDTVHEPDEDERTGPSSATVLVTILLVIGLGTTFGLALGKRKQLRAWYKKMLNKEEDLIPMSPTSSQQGRPRFISFDMTPPNRRKVTYQNPFYRLVEEIKSILPGFNSRKKDILKAYIGSSLPDPALKSGAGLKNTTSIGSPQSDSNQNDRETGMFRLITNISKSRSRESSTEPSDESVGNASSDAFNFENNLKSAKRNHVNIERISNPQEIISPMSEISEESATQNHPLSKVIPPMIVIDNVDNSPAKTDAQKGRESMVLEKGIEAASTFVSSLQGPPTLIPMLDLTQFSTWHNNENSTKPFSPMGIIIDSDSEDDDSASVASTPVHSTTPKSELSNSRSWSANALDKLDKFDTMKSPMPLLTLPSKFLIDSNEMVGLPMEGELDDGLSIELVFGRSGTPNSQVSPMNSSSGHERFGFLNSIRALSPGGSSKGSGVVSLKRPSFAKMGVMKKKLPRSGSDRFELTSSNETNSSKVELVATVPPLSAQISDSRRLEFKVPRAGQLGLVIEARTRTGPVVHSVKDYSPLFGKIMKGDRICEIDGKNQKGSTLSDVMHLLASKPGRLLSNANLKLVVERKIQKMNQIGSTAFESSHTRDDSYGSCSVASSNRIIEDVDSMIADLRSKQSTIDN